MQTIAWACLISYDRSHLHDLYGVRNHGLDCLDKFAKQIHFTPSGALTSRVSVPVSCLLVAALFSSGALRTVIFLLVAEVIIIIEKQQSYENGFESGFDPDRVV